MNERGAAVTAGDFTRANWRKSSFSDANTNCVELAAGAERVGVRDSKNVTGPVLSFGAAEFARFLGER